MHHHHLWAASHQVGAVRHGDREVLMRDQHGLGNLCISLLSTGERFHDRWEIGPGIHETILGTVIGECM